MSQDRLHEKALFKRLRIPVAAHAAVDTHGASCVRAAASSGLPGVLKTRRMGYDGKGQFVIERRADIDAAWELIGGEGLIYEKFQAFSREVSDRRRPLRRRATSCTIRCRPTPTRGGILRYGVAPVRERARSSARAKTYLKRVMSALDYVGVLAIEFFVVKGRLVANEMAPRVHNSGHWTIEGCVTSQFENHLRAICGLPLGSTRALGHTAMINFLGQMPEPRAAAGHRRAGLPRLRQGAAAGPQAGPLHHPEGAAGGSRPGARGCTKIDRVVLKHADSPHSRRLLEMYLELFKLHELPFRLSPDPQFLYLSKQHARAKAYMESTIWFTDGFVVITGEIGAGKTTLIETFLRELQAGRGGRADQSDPALAHGVPADRARAVRLHALRHEEAGGAGDAQSIPDRAARRRPQGAVDHRRGAELELSRARGDPHAFGHRDDQGKGPAHHPRGPARAQRQAQFQASWCSSRSACACVFT